VKLIEKFSNPQIRISENKIEVRDERTSRTKELFDDYKTHSKDESKIKLPPFKEIKEPEYQVSVNVVEVRLLKI
jgi:hypothetical protein